MKFDWTGEQFEKYASWLLEHDKICRFAGSGNTGAIGGRLTYTFTPTSIGMVTKVCCACGTELDLSDYDSW